MDQPLPLFRQKRFTGILIVTSLFALWWLRSPVSVFLAWIGDRQAVSVSIQGYGLWGPVVLFVLMVMQVFLAVIPGHALMLAAGYVYGFAASLLITLVSTVLGSQVAFWIARRFGRAAVDRLANPDYIQRWHRFADQRGILFFFFTFVLPIFPSDLMCYVAGLGTISPKRFFVANLLGRLVCATFITLIGANGLQMPVFFWVSSVLVLAALYGGWRVYHPER